MVLIDSELMANSNRSKAFIGGIVLGAIAMAGLKYFGRKKNLDNSPQEMLNRNNNPEDKLFIDQTYKSEQKHDIPLTEEAKKMLEDLRTEAIESFEKLKHETEEKTKQLNEKLLSKAHDLKAGAEDKRKAIQMEMEEYIDRYKEDTDRIINNFQNRIEGIHQRIDEFEDLRKAIKLQDIDIGKFY